MTRAELNPTAGKLTIQGTVDLAALRQEARKENYLLTPVGGQAQGPTEKERASWELLRAGLALVALLAGYGLGKLSGAAPIRVGAHLPLYLGFYTMAIILGGWGNFRKAYYSLPHLDFNMSVLMSTAVIGAAAIGQWEEGAVVAFLYAVSEMLEAWTMDRARQSIRQLINLAPKRARIRQTGVAVEVPVEDVQVGDVMLIRPGEMIALDGQVISGASAVNQAAITGESVPVDKGPGAEVYAGTLNTYGALEVEVTKRAADTTLARIIELVEDAQAKKAPSQAFVDRFAAVYTPVVLTLAAMIVLVPPLLLGQAWAPWIYRGLALLVVACPCALVVSTPVAIVSAVGNAARNGVLIKGGIYLEAAGTLSAIALDKTGTLTTGRPVMTDLVPLGGATEMELLQAAISLEAQSEHPIARAIVLAAQEKGLTPQPVEDFRALPGLGAQGRIGGRDAFVGNLRLLEDLGQETPGVRDEVQRLQARGKTAVIVIETERLLGVIAVADALRDDGKQVIASLKRLGIREVIVLTGDNEATARAVANQVGADDFRAGLLPPDTVTAIEQLIAEHGQVAMVGDGINDAPALALATVGIAMGGAGTDAALETADIVLMGDALDKLPFTIQLSRATLRVIRQNIGFSLAIKLLAVLAVFPGWLTLWLAILADMGASVLVTLNGIRLLRINPERSLHPGGD